MKIYTAEQLRNADQYTIANEPISSIDLMERAASAAAKWIRKRSDKKRSVFVVCGPGNNGGDGLVIARKLLAKGYSVSVCKVNFNGKYSDDFLSNEKRWKETGNGLVEISETNRTLSIPEDAIVIDALFGSGLNREVKGWLATLIESINNSPALKIAIDLPSGLFCSDNDQNKGAIVKAHITLSFQFPKIAFMFPKYADYIGKWEVLPIGIHEEFIVMEPTHTFYITEEVAKLLYKRRHKFSHKGSYGHALIAGGSKGMLGAAVLSSKACMRTGAGLTTTFVPKCGENVLPIALPEALSLTDDHAEYLTNMIDVGKYNAIAIGPGLGTAKPTYNVVKTAIQNAGKPIVFDADAINILAENKTWLEFIPKGSILTPHIGELNRLIGRIGDDFTRMNKVIEFAKRYKVYVVVKGAHTAITTPMGEVYFNSTGNPGMATAGSGDVLTGIITGLLAQSYAPGQAAILGVYLHGLAGDFAVKKRGMEAMMASDIIEHIGNAFGALKAIDL